MEWIGQWDLDLGDQLRVGQNYDALEIDVRIIFLYLVCGMHLSLAYNYVSSIFCGGAGKNGSTVAVRDQVVVLYTVDDFH